MPAKKKGAKKKVGAVRKQKRSGERLIGLIVGAAGTAFANKFIGDKVDGKILAAGEMAIGWFLPTFVKGDFVAGVGDGVFSAGGLNLLQEFGVVNGLPLIAGYRDMNAINGLPQELENMAVQPQQTFKKFGSMANVINGMNSQYDENRIS